MTVRKDFLETKLMAFLDRRTPPRALSDQAQIDEASALVRALDRLAPRNGYDEWWRRFEDALTQRERSRAWPIVAEIQSAAESLKSRGSEPSGEEPAHVYDMVRSWWLEHRDPMPSLAKMHHAGMLVAEGIATWPELHFAGFPLPAIAYPSGWKDDWRDPKHREKRAAIRSTGHTPYEQDKTQDRKPHWSETVGPDDVRWQILAYLRERNAIVGNALMTTSAE